MEMSDISHRCVRRKLLWVRNTVYICFTTALLVSDVCQCVSNLDVIYGNFRITYLSHTCNLCLMYQQHVGICWKFCVCTKYLAGISVQQLLPSYIYMVITYSKLTPNLCNLRYISLLFIFFIVSLSDSLLTRKHEHIMQCWPPHWLLVLSLMDF